MDATYSIRRAVAADIERVIELDERIEFVPHWATNHYLGALAPAEHVAHGDGTRRCFYVAFAGEGLVGFAVGRVTALDAEVLAELESVGVVDSARRRGVGQELCGAVIKWARGEKARNIELEVRSRSEGAVAMYRRLGFAVAGMRRRYYRSPDDDAILMRLGLGAELFATAVAEPLRDDREGEAK